MNNDKVKLNTEQYRDTTKKSINVVLDFYNY